MNVLRVMLFIMLALTWVSDCSARSVSGAYLNKGQDFVELLQVTAKPEGGLTGTLTHTALNSDGSLSQDNTPLDGAVDGHAITVVLKAPLSFLVSKNLSGTVDDGAITLTLPNGVVRYVASDLGTYQLVVAFLHDRGAAIQQQRRLDKENEAVADLNKRLIDYATRNQSSRADQLLKDFHSSHERALAKARRGLDVQQRYPRNSLQASQIAVDISQIEVRLQTYDTQWELVPDQAHAHLRDMDLAIAQSLCNHSGAALSHCAEQLDAIRSYQAVKPIVERGVADIKATLDADHAAMDAIVRRANAYVR